MKIAVGVKAASCLALAALFAHSAAPVQGSSNALAEEVKPGELQRQLDRRCTEHVRKMCAANQLPKLECEEGDYVARFGPLGLTAHSRRDYACYKKSTIADGAVEMECYDDCMMPIKCQGTVNVNTQKVLAGTIVLEWGTELKSSYCSPRQAAANRKCSPYGDSWVARFDGGGKEQDDLTWRCYNTADIFFEESSLCADNCRGLTPCVGGPRRDKNKVSFKSSATELLKAMNEVGSPCDAGQFCVPTRVNPPTCRPPSSGEDAESQHADEKMFSVLVLPKEHMVTMVIPGGTRTLQVRLGKCHEVNLVDGRKITYRHGTGGSEGSLELPKEPANGFRILLVRSANKISLGFHGKENNMADVGYTVSGDQCESRAKLYVTGLQNSSDMTADVEPVSQQDEEHQPSSPSNGSEEL
ncbi:microneme protein [Cystoisospora suis]|uniref:Microneme protein n=1 Tax=Cystoisospora suis TaxID=483139 RepID=A0A2C6KF54_9APIC|nr:microneme protein [Cystoisospora suis]